MHEHEVTLEYRDNCPELKRRLAEDYNLPLDDEVVNAMLDSAIISVDRGYAELEPIRAKYGDLICPWCGHLHYRKKCIELSRKYEAEKQGKRE
jgi:predicted RNA-binding Zn-ribbon protein involved in translation (DUF1610 family)